MLWSWKYLFMYLWVVLAHYPNPVKHSHNVSPEILTTVVAWYQLKTNDLCLNFPFPCLYPNPICCNSKKWHLCCINHPTICSYWDGPWGFLYHHWCISNVLYHEKSSHTLISASSLPNQHTNSLCRWLTTSCMLGRSSNVDFGHITTKQFQKVVLSATASNYGTSKTYSTWLQL